MNSVSGKLWQLLLVSGKGSRIYLSFAENLVAPSAGRHVEMVAKSAPSPSAAADSEQHVGGALRELCVCYGLVENQIL